MRRIKAHGRKSWNCGWRHRDRPTLNRTIERKFRATERTDVGEGLDEIEDDRDEVVRIVDFWEEQDRDLEYELDLQDDAIAMGLWTP